MPLHNDQVVFWFKVTNICRAALFPAACTVFKLNAVSARIWLLSEGNDVGSDSDVEIQPPKIWL